MGHRAQERAYRPQEREGSHPPPQHRLYDGSAMNERYKERLEGASRRTHHRNAALRLDFFTRAKAGVYPWVRIARSDPCRTRLHPTVTDTTRKGDWGGSRGRPIMASSILPARCREPIEEQDHGPTDDKR